MSFHDRDYNREPGGPERVWGGGLGRKLLYLLNYSFSIGTYLDIRVRIHITFVLLFVFYLASDYVHAAWIWPWWTLRWTSLLFLSVLLHEFGHCLACRSVGGRADDILMWPLGGLAFCAPPRRPWPEFVTVIWGPLVNLIIAASCYATLLAWQGAEIAVSLNPLRLFEAPVELRVQGFIQDLYYVNYLLLAFNVLLIFYPFDGGRLVHVALWTRLGYEKSLHVAVSVGMIGAVLVGLYGIIERKLLLLCIAVFGFITCYQQRQILRYERQAFGPEFETAYGPPGGLEQRRESALARWRRRRRQRAERKRAQRLRRLEDEVDRILAKVHREGMDGLSSREKRTLHRASELKRRV